MTLSDILSILALTISVLTPYLYHHKAIDWNPNYIGAIIIRSLLLTELLVVTSLITFYELQDAFGFDETNGMNMYFFVFLAVSLMSFALSSYKIFRDRDSDDHLLRLMIKNIGFNLFVHFHLFYLNILCINDLNEVMPKSILRICVAMMAGIGLIIIGVMLFSKQESRYEGSLVEIQYLDKDFETVNYNDLKIKESVIHIKMEGGYREVNRAAILSIEYKWKLRE